MGIAPESLLIELASDPHLLDTVQSAGPLVVAFDNLTQLDGWTINPVSKVSLAPFDLLSLSTDDRVLAACLVAADFAIRRGAVDIQTAEMILRRESPVRIIMGSVDSAQVRELVIALGIDSSDNTSFSRRAHGHRLSGDTTSDPALSFKIESVDSATGDNALSSFIVHGEGERDGVSVVGTLSDRWAVEIGLPAQVDPALQIAIEREIVAMPSFIPGVMSHLEDDRLVIEWASDTRPNPHDIGAAIHAWTRSLFDLDLVDVRIVFAPEHGRSAVLTDMRARAQAYRRYRLEVVAGDPNPEATVTAFMKQPGENA